MQVAWTREEEFFYDTFDPAAVVKFASALDGAGRITLWSYDVWAAGQRSADLFYDVPNVRIRSYRRPHGRAASSASARSASTASRSAPGAPRAPT